MMLSNRARRSPQAAVADSFAPAMTRLADAFAEIRARREELARDRDAAISGQTETLPAEWLSPEAAERKQSHERFTAQEIDELAKLLGRPVFAGPLACAFACVDGGSIECVRGPSGFVVSAHGLSLGPFGDLDMAMKAARVFLDLDALK